MALVSCPECGKEVSAHAEACPNCGCPKDVILESIKKRTEKLKPVETTKETKELTEEELAKRKAYLDELAELEEAYKQAYKQAMTDIDNTLKFIEKHKENKRKNKQKPWTFMNSGSLPQFRRLSFYCFSQVFIVCFFLFPDFLSVVSQKVCNAECLFELQIYLFFFVSSDILRDGETVSP
ncbi:MAG: hypothetical protein PUJ69_02920 [Porphyromonas somerae]|uniref:hypothetical protein n=1 Tax=Porphyromonas somerae TaxID=322095 RepID=UPI0026EFBD79|nr:hypothetical protein [Porphyromonas somerae]MDD6906031.1 hypothetical protein [Finegoldia magna]MDD7557604.1 hypothetical protein [Porphyromonas somerae]MDY3884402.1 hypothetical protein [Porphyromonas somerae]MDY5815817.1 hypothetical protein [Porphyromonas somerae]